MLRVWHIMVLWGINMTDNELKTLKDLLCFGREIGKSGTDNSMIFTKDLRQESIKWIKEFKKHSFKTNSIELPNGEILEEGCEETDISGSVISFKCFFNINESDLL
jgi:hypothetical protein